LTFDLRRALRRIKPHRFTAPLPLRPLDALSFVTMQAGPGRELLLDTGVYIDVLQGRSPPAVDALLRHRTLNHLTVCIGELLQGFGRLDPRHPGTDAVLDQLARTIEDIPAHRMQTASETVVAEAGILAGLLFRLRGLERGREVAAMNDATLYLHAMATGQAVLTRNLHDFDVMQQILPDGHVLFYQPAD
jgi:predicted nucleic acid-binding protein